MSSSSMITNASSSITMTRRLVRSPPSSYFCMRRVFQFAPALALDRRSAHLPARYRTTAMRPLFRDERTSEAFCQPEKFWRENREVVGCSRGFARDHYAPPEGRNVGSCDVARSLSDAFLGDLPSLGARRHFRF